MQDYHLIHSKLLPPYLNNQLIDRPRFRKILEDNPQVTLITISAPAGYGKTVLLSQLTTYFTNPVVWYHLDSYDNDPLIFWSYLIAGFQKNWPDFGQDYTAILSDRYNTSGRHRMMLSYFLSELDKLKTPVTLVLDDYHLIATLEIHHFMEDLLANLPIFLRVLIASRVKIPFSLYRLTTNGMALHFKATDLNFNPEEIKSFLSAKQQPFTEEFIHKIADYTNGWPLALSLLSGHLPKDLKLPESQKQLLFEYLATEVLANQDPTIQEFMVAISVLDTITPESCNQLLDRDEAQQILESLAKQQLFLIPLAVDRQIYQYHHLFRDFLLERLENNRQPLFIKAGQIAWKTGEIVQAVECFLAAGAWDEAIKGIIHAGHSIFSKGNWQTVARWLATIPKEKVTNEPWLSLYQAQIEFNKACINEGEAWANHAAALFSTQNDQSGLAESQIFQARILRFHGRYQDSLCLFEQAVSKFLKGQGNERFDILLDYSYTLILCGQFQKAEKTLKSALEKAQATNNHSIISQILEGLGNVYFTTGDPQKSFQCFMRGIEVSPAKTLRNYYLQDAVALIYLKWGETDLAYQYLTESISRKESLGLIEALPSAYQQLGDVLMELGNLTSAEKSFRKSLKLIEENNGDRFVLTLTLISLGLCLGAQGRQVEAETVIERSRSAVKGQSDYINTLYQILEAIFLLQSGKPDQCLHQLEDGARRMETFGAMQSLSSVYKALAMIHLSNGNDNSGIEYTRRSLQLAAAMKHRHEFLNSCDTCQPVLKLGLQLNLEVTFIQSILAQLEAKALPLLTELTTHSDPGVRLRTIPVLTEINSKKSLEILSVLGADSDSEVRNYAQTMLRRKGITPSSTRGQTFPEPLLTILMVGPIRIYHHQKEITSVQWITNKARDLLIFLAHLEGPAEKQKVLESLWSELPFEQANSLFHTTIYNLRQVLVKECSCYDLVLYRGSRYALSPGSILTDKQRFLELLQAADKKPHLTTENAPLLEEAIGLYRGDYLGELDYTWVLPLQEQLKHLHIDAREKLSRYYLENNDYSRAIVHLKAILQTFPLSEEYHRYLMTSYAGLGDLKSVEKQYQELTQDLKDELGLDPSNTTREHYYNLFR
ncbi:MAG TPA: tetratricopeptide repeat protein [Bacillota bacterium]|nr:tetratricopeptide repeat protein [Bacillota bacterium]